MSKAKPAKNSHIQIGDGAGSETFNTIAEVLSFSGVPEETKEVDVTSQDSTAREYISDALPDSPDITMECNFVGSAATQQQLRTDLRSGVLRNFKYILNDHSTTPTTISFAAVVKGLSGPSFGSAGDAYKTSITLKRSGPSTITQYAPS